MRCGKRVRPARLALPAPAGVAAALRLSRDQSSPDIAAELRRDYVKEPKVGVFALPDRFGGLNSAVMVPTGYPVQPGDAIYVLERFF